MVSAVARTTRQNTKMNTTTNRQDLPDLYRAFYSITAEYTFFSSVHRTLTKIDHILSHKQILQISKN